MNGHFELAFSHLIKNEGIRYTENPLDSGGSTKFGITLKYYSIYLGRLVSRDELKNLTLEDAKKFYWDSYWIPLRCDDLSSLPIKIALFDMSVLYGIHTAVDFAQKAIGCCGYVLKCDGIMGDKTVTALNAVDEKDFIAFFYQFILRRIQEIIRKYPKNEAFRKGWTARAERVLNLC